MSQQGIQDVTLHWGSHLLVVSEGKQVLMVSEGNHQLMVPEGNHHVMISEGNHLLVVTEGNQLVQQLGNYPQVQHQDTPLLQAAVWDD